MFQFPPFSLTCLYIQHAVLRHYSKRVAPFGNPRMIDCLRLSEAYRSLPRPSSTLCTKASTVYPLYLDQNFNIFLLLFLFISMSKNFIVKHVV
jgi:hypothetical protein